METAIATMRDSLPLQPKGAERGGDANSAALLLPNENTSTHQVSGIRCTPTLLCQHLVPDGVVFPSDMLSLVDFELLYSGIRVIPGNTLGVQRDESIDCGRVLVLGALQEREPRPYNVVHV